VPPVLSCVSQSMDRGVPAYHFADQPLAQSYPSFPSCCISPTWLAQFLIASSYSRSQEQSHKMCLQNPGRRIKKAGCMYGPESGRTRAKAKAKNDSDSHLSCLLLTVLSHQTQPTPTDSLFREKQSKATKCQISRAAHELRRADASRTLVTPCVTIVSISRKSGESRGRGGCPVVLVVCASVGGSCEAELHFGGLANNNKRMARIRL
jgi:hypothetical protein